MVENKDVYRCYSFNLMQFLTKHNVRYILVAKDIKSDKVFYLYEKTEMFLKLLQRWIDNSPKN